MRIGWGLGIFVISTSYLLVTGCFKDPEDGAIDDTGTGTATSDGPGTTAEETDDPTDPSSSDPSTTATDPPMNTDDPPGTTEGTEETDTPTDSDTQEGSGCDKSPCDENAACDDSGDEVVCECNEGFEGDGKSCEDIDECENGTHDCDQNANCTNTPGSFTCECKEGYSGNPGAACSDINECTAHTDNCHVHAECINEPGSFSCVCETGWEGDGVACELAALEWVNISGGSFMMGDDDASADSQKPEHLVSIAGFEMTKTEITVGQFEQCVADGACSSPSAGESTCNWGRSGAQNHPINCVTWYQARAFCEWLGGRLPSEAEWEYAARSRGQDIKYPWGAETPTCTRTVMMGDDGVYGCGTNRTMEVCSKAPDITVQGLCDMGGNISEWNQDWMHESYQGAPSDGSAWITPSSSDRTVRGGAFPYSAVTSYPTLGIYLENFSTRARGSVAPSSSLDFVGFRCARY